jgi:hypothetical protein
MIFATICDFQEVLRHWYTSLWIDRHINALVRLCRAPVARTSIGTRYSATLSITV